MPSSEQLSDQAATALRERILSGELPPGTRLPPERRLTEELGISRTALREALRSLEGMGLVEAQVGRGRFVSDTGSPRRSTVAVSNWLQLHRTDLEDLSEVRELLEPRALCRTPAGSVAGVVARATEVTERQHAAVKRGDLALAGRLDVEFHDALVGSCRNVPLRTLTRALVASSAEASVAVYATARVARHSIGQHEAILAALARGALDEAAGLLAEHQRTASRLAFGDAGDAGNSAD